MDYEQDPTAPIDWDAEQRTDLPMRSPERIQYLLKFETPQQTLARIANDLSRYAHQKSGTIGTNPQTRQVSPTATVPSVARWGN